MVAEFQQVNSTISNDVFTFLITSPGRSGRYFSSITLDATNVNCSYPGYHFTHTFAEDSCTDHFTGSFDITELRDSCNFNQEEPTQQNDFKTILSGSVQISAIDYIDVFRGHTIYRTTTSSLNIELSLPSFANLTAAGLTVFSPISTLAAVTKQEYNPQSDVATIELTTSVQWPYTLFLASTPLVINPFPSASISVGIIDVECEQADVGSSCLQVTTLTISNLRSIPDQCDFNGAYRLAWNYNCRSGQADCPVDGSDVAQISFNLTSGDICQQINIVAKIDGDLTSHTDDTFNEERLVIVAGERIYLKAALTADVSIQDIVVKELRIIQQQQQGAPKVIVQDGFATSDFSSSIAYNDAEGTLTPNQKRISFLATYGVGLGDIFSSATPDGVFSFTIEADLEVTYRTTFGRKRDISSTSMSFAAQGVLLAPKH